MGECLDDLAHVGEIDLLIGSVDVGFRSAHAKCHDLCLGILLLQFLEERN
jgi:hypothetical protein